MFGKFFPILPWKKKKLLPIRKKSSGNYTQNITISFQFLYKTLCLLYKILENLYKNRKKKQTNYHTYAEFFSFPCTSLSFSAAKTTGNFYTSISSGSKSA